MVECLKIRSACPQRPNLSLDILLNFTFRSVEKVNLTYQTTHCLFCSGALGTCIDKMSNEHTLQTNGRLMMKNHNAKQSGWTLKA